MKFVDISGANGDGQTHSIDSYVSVENSRPRICSVGVRCWSKRCQTCAAIRCKIIKSNMVKFGPGEGGYHIVLTNKAKNDPLVSQIQKLKSDFRRLRQRTIWHRHLLGAIFSIHLVTTKSPERWLPHIHIFGQGYSMENLAWSNHWRAITGDSHIVHVEEVPRNDDEKFRIANYIVRPPAALFAHNSVMMDEYITATRRTALVGLLGVWRGTPLLARPIGELSDNVSLAQNAPVNSPQNVLQSFDQLQDD